MNPIGFIPYHLILQPDQTWKAELRWHYSNPDAEIDQTDVEELTFRVVSKDGERYKISVARRLIKTELPGVTVKAPDNSKVDTSEAKVDPGCLFVLPAWTLDPNTKRLSRLFDFGKLPAVETWQMSSQEKGLPQSETVVSEIAADSTEPSLRAWRWDFREMGSGKMSATGVLWTRKKDGFPIAMHIEAQNATLPGGTDTVGLVLDLKLKADDPQKD